MAEKHGALSINSDNILPIIKKWLYSDHDIFYRELISNGCDAITKLKKLDMMGEYELPEGYKPRVDVIVDPDAKTIQFIDNGVGMTADEVEEYINQIAFSGATDFIAKYKDKTNDDQIIGHFGLGFYSAFMVADEVHIDTLSWQKDAKPVHWECDGGTEYDMQDGTRTEVGTCITLFLNEDCLQFCNEYKATEVIKKYCSFMPVEIYVSSANTPETQTILASEKLDSDHVIEEVKKEKEEDPDKLKITKRPELINDTHPLWTKNPSECTKEEYVDFYRKVFMDYLKDKINAIATKIYRADGVNYSAAASKTLAELTDMGYGNLPVCIAKTQYSFSDNAKLIGAPTGFTMEVREVRLAAGAGFVVVICGNIMTMPGLPKKPAAVGIDVDANGKITGLF